MSAPGPSGWHLPTIILALTIGAAGGFTARALGLPLPMLLGALVTTAAAAIAGFRPTGRVAGLPFAVRQAFIPVIGVSIGSALTPDTLAAATAWWPSLLALLVYIPLAHAMGYALTGWGSALDKPTRFFGSMPGGFIEAMTLSEKYGGDVAYVTILQFLRLIVCIVSIPLAFQIITGDAVGTAGGAVIGDAPEGLTPRDWAILVACGVLGALLGKALRLPAGILTGPFLVSGVAHVAGWVTAGPPGWLIEVTQLVIGTSLGARFAGRSTRMLVTGTRLALVNVAAMLVLSAVFAALLSGPVGQPFEAVFLAFAPGGVAEMALVAVSLQIGVIYVTVHHLLRIILAILLARLALGRALGSGEVVDRDDPR